MQWKLLQITLFSLLDVEVYFWLTNKKRECIAEIIKNRTVNCLILNTTVGVPIASNSNILTFMDTRVVTLQRIFRLIANPKSLEAIRCYIRFAPNNWRNSQQQTTTTVACMTNVCLLRSMHNDGGGTQKWNVDLFVDTATRRRRD